MRIAILDNNDKVVAFLDNGKRKALHFWDDILHNYLEGTSGLFEFTADAMHPDSEHLVVGNHLSFRYGSRDYYFNIAAVRRTEYDVTVTAYALVFELLNEQTSAYEASKAMSFTDYMAAFDFADTVLTIGINEVADKKITYTWDGSDTILARLFSLASVFDAELEFIPVLKETHTLDRIVLNIYKEHSDTTQGAGTNRRDKVLRYGVDISGVEKKTDITELITAIRPIGHDNLTISALEKQERDADGNLEFVSEKGSRNILAVQAVQQFPSNTLANVSDRYIVKEWSYDTEDVNVLYGQALAELKSCCVPTVEYTIDGYIEAEIGDTFTIQDQEFSPPLYLSVRVSEQEISFTDPARNKTTYSNAKELQNEIDSDLMKRVEALTAETKTHIESLNGEIVSVREEIADQNVETTAACEQIMQSALEDYTKTDDFESFADQMETRMKTAASDVDMAIAAQAKQLKAVNDELQDKFNTITKYLAFDVNGLTIGQIDNPYKVIIDNDRYSMTVNGVEVLWFDGNGKGHIPELTITKTLNLFGYLLDMDESGNVNCEYVGGMDG